MQKLQTQKLRDSWLSRSGPFLPCQLTRFHASGANHQLRAAYPLSGANAVMLLAAPCATQHEWGAGRGHLHRAKVWALVVVCHRNPITEPRGAMKMPTTRITAIAVKGSKLVPKILNRFAIQPAKAIKNRLTKTSIVNQPTVIFFNQFSL